MKVTINDVLAAGGEIFGLPIKRVWADSSLHVGFVMSSIDDDDDVEVAFESDTGESTPKNFEIIADGIRILDIDGKLWRVTGHVGLLGTDATIEPLIPDKPAEPEEPAQLKPKICATCKHCEQFAYTGPCADCDVRGARKNWEPKPPDEPDSDAKTCRTCKHESKFNSDYPCRGCMHIMADMWEPKPKVCDTCGQELPKGDVECK
jgi:hypothetical protein